MFPDIASVLCIRDALWRHKILGSASIMIGAGFSRNADALSSSARPMPNWSQMAEALCHPLYPLDDARRQSALKEASGTSGFLRLAQEYQAAFGPGSLNDRIRNLVPDLDYRPGDLHRRLLRLPWADVFSTNWDTLLERACSDVFERSYDVVRTTNDIPFTMRPRIVKLHGSFPAHEPFVFTEEEYRTYPVRFSPFVNLVQQSMMETIFCLLGFSGDDPNFLHWSGWVRDNLGENGPKIYLVGWLELSNHRRRMLEARNVMPIDLSALPEAINWPPDQRHRYAAEWFIAALELGKPYSASSWPQRPAAPAPPPLHLGSIPATTQPLPRDEPRRPATNVAPADQESIIKSAIEAWAYNRRLYPGWLIAPENIRRALQRSLQEWHGTLLLLSNISSLDRLKVLSELAWRTERALFTFPADHEELARAALGTIDRVARTIDGQPVPKTESWSELLKGADTLARSLARNARHAGNRERFDQSLDFLKKQQDHDAELRNAVAYEECLWSVTTGDLKGLLTRLDAWIPAHGETLWSLRKAGLLAEMQDHTRACALLEKTLTQIRRARRRDVDDLVSLSLESWALFLALGYSRPAINGMPALPADMPEPFERWRALGSVDCDAFKDFRTMRRALEAATPRVPDVTKRRGFDLDHVGTTHHIGREPSPTLIAAYEIVMLAELTGLPSLVNNMIVLGDGLKLAVRTLSADQPWIAASLAIRTNTDNKLLDDVFSRAWIARLPEQLVEILQDALLKRFAFGLSLVGPSGSRGRDATSLVGTALELLSRVAVRLRSDQLRTLFEEAISHYRSPTFRRKSIYLGIPLAHLVARVLESLPRADILDLLPVLFSLPLPGAVGKSPHEDRWQDPVGLLPEWLDEPFKDAVERAPAWETIIPPLLVAAKDSGAIDRAAAIGRLFRLFRWRVLTEEEISAFAEAVWTPNHRDQFGLPSHTGLHQWVLLEMPEERPGQARDALIKFIENLSHQLDGDLSNRLAEVGEVLRHFERLEIAFELTDSVRAALIGMIDAWAGQVSARPIAFDPFMESHNRERDAIEGVAIVLPTIGASDELYHKIWVKISAQIEGGLAQAFALYPVLARHWPERMSEFIDGLRRALVSDKEDDVNGAVQGLFRWISAQPKQTVSTNEVLDDLVREVGIAIAARRIVLLRSALSFARWIFNHGPERLRSLIANDCDYGLAALVEEASYSRSEQAFDVPAIRAACVRLASAMASAGFDQGRGVKEWQATSESDPLPEVRNAEIRKRSEESNRQSG